jgi:hypothetical protein
MVMVMAGMQHAASKGGGLVLCADSTPEMMLTPNIFCDVIKALLSIHNSY